MKVIRLCLVVSFLLMSVSCSLKTNWDLVGKWENAESKETIEFARDNMVTVTHDGVSLVCNYRFTDPKHMEIVVGSLGSFVMKVVVSGGTLTLTDSNGKVTKYHKVK